VAPLKEKKKVRIDTFVSPEVDEQLTRLAKKREVYRARIIEAAILEYLERHKDELNK